MERNPRNAEYTKEYNRKMFLRLLRTDTISRAEIARRMGLSRAATSLIADELLLEGLIQETEACETQIGRTPVPLKLRRDAAYAAGIYLNRDGCTVGVVDICGDVPAQTRLRLTSGSGQGRLNLLTDTIRELVQKANVSWDKIVGVGVSAPGPLDGENGRILNPPSFDLWHHTNIGPLLSRELGLPVYLENNASCLARYNQGKAETMGSEDFLLLLVDSGIGSGVVSGGKILKGKGYFTSELGHTTIDYCGKPCACGNYGCLEAYAAIPNLLRNEKFKTWREVMDCLPDTNAEIIMNREAEYLAAGITTLVNVVSVDTVLLAGELLYGIDQFAPILERKINDRIIRRNIIPVRVLPSSSGPDLWVRAAADVAFGRFLMV